LNWFQVELRDGGWKKRKRVDRAGAVSSDVFLSKCSHSLNKKFNVIYSGNALLYGHHVMLVFYVWKPAFSTQETKAYEYDRQDECANRATHIESTRPVEGSRRSGTARPYMKARLHEAMNIVSQTLEEVTR